MYKRSGKLCGIKKRRISFLTGIQRTRWYFSLLKTGSVTFAHASRWSLSAHSSKAQNLRQLKVGNINYNPQEKHTTLSSVMKSTADSGCLFPLGVLFLTAAASTPLSTDALHSTVCFFPWVAPPLSAPAAVNHAESSLLIGCWGCSSARPSSPSLLLCISLPPSERRLTSLKDTCLQAKRKGDRSEKEFISQVRNALPNSSVIKCTTNEPGCD